MIPESMFMKEPSAELKPDQKDSDRLPPYTILDPILKEYIEDDISYREIISRGFSEKTVADVIRMIDRSEYKRTASRYPLPTARGSVRDFTPAGKTPSPLLAVDVRRSHNGFFRFFSFNRSDRDHRKRTAGKFPPLSSHLAKGQGRSRRN